MWRTIKRWWRYLSVKARLHHEETADPKVQLEQALLDAREQHARLTDQAASVVANQKSAQARLDQAVEEYERVKTQAGHALRLADHKARTGNLDEASRFTHAAEVLATRLSVLERDITDREAYLMQATVAAERAKKAVADNADALRGRLADRERLLSDLDQAKMQERMNAALTQLAASIGDDVPTFDEVRRKIGGRLARANAMAEITAQPNVGAPDSVLIEVEQAQLAAEAESRLVQLRYELGLSGGVLRALPGERAHTIEGPDS